MLPSKYAPGGISVEESKKPIVVGHKINKPTEYIIKTIERKVDDALRNQSEDIEMIPIDDDSEVSIISAYVNTSRLEQSEIDEFAMDLDYKEVIIEPNYSYLVIDTNFVLSNLQVLDDIRKVADKYKLKIIVPITVIRELDGLKKSTKVMDENFPGLKGKTIGHLARWANNWLYNELGQGSIVKGQKPYQKIDKSTIKDDSILDCCIYFKHTNRNNLIVLLSNDKNLCLKALTNDILTVSYQQHMTGELIGETIYNEASSLGNITAPAPSPPIVKQNQIVLDHVTVVYNELLVIVKSAIHHVMMNSFGDDLNMTDYDAKSIYNLNDCKIVIEKYWISSFNEYLPSLVKTFVTHIPVNKSQAAILLDQWQQFLVPIYHQLLDTAQNKALFELIDRWHVLLQ